MHVFRAIDPDDNRLFEETEDGKWAILSIKDGRLVRNFLSVAPSHALSFSDANDWSDEEIAEWIAENSDPPELP